MAFRTLLVAIGFSEVLTSEPCPADFMSQAIDSHGQIENMEEVETLDLVNMIQVQVSVTHHRRSLSPVSWNSSEMKGPSSDMNTTDVVLNGSASSSEKKTPSDHLAAKDENLYVAGPGSSVFQERDTTTDTISSFEPSALADRSSEHVDHTGIEVQKEVSETHSGPITVRSLQQQRHEQQEVALFVESLAEELVHDSFLRIRNAINSAWKLPGMMFSASQFLGILPSQHYLDGDPRVWRFIAYSEIILVVLLAVASLSQQRKRWHVPHLQTAEVQLIISLAALALVARIEAKPSWCLALTLGLRYFVEGCMLFIGLYILPSTLGHCMAEAQIIEQRRAAEYFVMEGGGLQHDSCYTTPSLLDVAIKQQMSQPEISPLLTSLPPMPSLLKILLCVLRPLLAVSCALVQHRQPLAMPICFWLNTWLVVIGLVLTAALARNVLSQMAQYVPTCEIVALSVGVLPLLGGLQDVGLCGNLNSDAISYVGMLYLHEVTAMSLFVMYMVSQGAHCPAGKILCVNQSQQVAGWKSWLQEVLNPFGLMTSLMASNSPHAESTENDGDIIHDCHSKHGLQRISDSYTWHSAA